MTYPVCQRQQQPQAQGATTGLCWLLFPMCCWHAQQDTGATHHSQETATAKPDFPIPASAGCDDFGSNGKLHHMVTLPSAQLSGEGPHLADSPLPKEVFLVLVLLCLASEGLHIVLLMQTMYGMKYQQPVLYSGKFQIIFFKSMKLISLLEHRMLLQLQVQKPLQSRLLLTQFLRL